MLWFGLNLRRELKLMFVLGQGIKISTLNIGIHGMHAALASASALKERKKASKAKRVKLKEVVGGVGSCMSSVSQQMVESIYRSAVKS